MTDQETLISNLAQDLSDPVAVRGAIAAIKAQYGVRETRAYAILVRAAAGCPATPVDPLHIPQQHLRLAG
jgi:hypothetical protein